MWASKRSGELTSPGSSYLIAATTFHARFLLARETVCGAGPYYVDEANRIVCKSDETLMHRGHDLWPATLKWVAEAK